LQVCKTSGRCQFPPRQEITCHSSTIVKACPQFRTLFVLHTECDPSRIQHAAAAAASRSGYQAAISLFLAPTSYSLRDYTSWPESDSISQQQAAFARVKVFPTIDYSYASLFTAAGGNSSGAGANYRIGSQQQV
jgi:hypothetical protein